MEGFYNYKQCVKVISRESNISCSYLCEIVNVAIEDIGDLFMYHTYVQCYIIDFTELKAHYHTILQLMPNDYELTVGKLLSYISDDQICVILSSSNSTIANKIILDCLIERMSCREELLDLCAQLENISTSHDLKIVINEIHSS